MRGIHQFIRQRGKLGFATRRRENQVTGVAVPRRHATRARMADNEGADLRQQLVE